MTAVQWLDEKLQNIMFVEYGYSNGVRKIVIPLDEYMRLKQVALHLEKMQIIDAIEEDVFHSSDKTAEQYYNETFNK
jgi:hypothetical protein